MKASELVDRWALRTKPIAEFELQYLDYRYTDEPIFILKVTEHHIYARNAHGTIVLNARFLDDNWIEADEAFFIAGSMLKPRQTAQQPERKLGRFLGN